MSRTIPARERLLDAADLLFEQGLAATPVDVVLERAQVSPATMYAHFGSKDGLLTEALHRRLLEWDAVWAAAIDVATTPAARLLAVFDALEEFRRTRRGARWCAFLGTAAEVGRPGEPLREAVEADTRLLRSRLEELARPVVGDAAPDLADDLLLVVTGTLAMALRDADPAGHVSRGRAVAGAVVEGYEPAG